MSLLLPIWCIKKNTSEKKILTGTSAKIWKWALKEQMWKRREEEEEPEDKEAGEEVEKCVDRWRRLCLAEGGTADGQRLVGMFGVCVCVFLDGTPHPLPT